MSFRFNIVTLLTFATLLGTGCANADSSQFVYKPFVPGGKPFPKAVERPDLALPLPPGAVKRTSDGNPKDEKNRLVLDAEFLNRALDTPSPQPWVWERYGQFFRMAKPEVKAQFWEQIFDNTLVSLSGNLLGDPDFCTLEVTAGDDFGLPSPGATTLTRLGDPGTDFQVDSFFDITYRIEFQGCPGSILEGMGGTTEDQSFITTCLEPVPVQGQTWSAVKMIFAD